VVILDLIKSFAAPIFGLIGVLVGSKLNMKRDRQIQKEFLSKKLRIEKYQQYSLDLSDYIREFASHISLIKKLITGKITHKEFRNLNDSKQENAIQIYRRLLANKVFIPEVYSERVEKLNDYYSIICNKIYEGFHEPNSDKRYHDNDEVTYEAIKKEIESSLSFGMVIYEEMTETLKKEIEGLK
jgi:hypothetical protein